MALTSTRSLDSASAPAPDPSGGTPQHPEDLARADRPYLVPWGRREVRRVLAVSLPLAAAVALLAVLVSPLWASALVPIGVLAAFLVLFFRNPARKIPSGPGLLVAPADGTVWDIEEVDEPRFVGERCVRVGIFLSIFNVHVNRAPACGRVEWVEHRDGRYHDARSPRAASENESNAIGLVREDAGGPPAVRLLVNQISGAIARRIICPLRPPVPVARGGLVGMIKYGSRTELYVPASQDLELQVRVGDKVRAGTTVLARWKESEEDR